MDFTFLTLLLSSPAFFTSFAVFLALEEREGVTIPLLAAAVFSALIGLLGFRASVIMGLRRLNQAHFKVSKKMASYLLSGEKRVCFEKKGNQWMCVGLGREVVFDLHGLVFKKPFLVAFAVRALRYQRLSSGLRWVEIGRLRLKGFPGSLVALAEFKAGKSCKQVRLCDNGVSRLGALSWLMVWCCAPQTLSPRFWHTAKDGLSTGHYCEEAFCARFARIKRDFK